MISAGGASESLGSRKKREPPPHRREEWTVCGSVGNLSPERAECPHRGNRSLSWLPGFQDLREVEQDVVLPWGGWGLGADMQQAGPSWVRWEKPLSRPSCGSQWALGSLQSDPTAVVGLFISSPKGAAGTGRLCSWVCDGWPWKETSAPPLQSLLRRVLRLVAVARSGKEPAVAGPSAQQQPPGPALRPLPGRSTTLGFGPSRRG